MVGGQLRVTEVVLDHQLIKSQLAGLIVHLKGVTGVFSDPAEPQIMSNFNFLLLLLTILKVIAL